MKIISLLLFLVLSFPLAMRPSVQDDTLQINTSKKAVLKVLDDQAKAWNKGNIESFMAGYWKSDSLKFIGKNGIRYGWNNTLEGYKKNYPDKATMGFLTFDILATESFSENTFFVIGKWALKREKDNVGGLFTLVFKKINGQWFIVCDHTS